MATQPASEAKRFDRIQIGHNGLSPNGTEFRVCAIDEDDRTVMDENGTWLFFADCDFPEYVW